MSRITIGLIALLLIFSAATILMVKRSPTFQECIKCHDTSSTWWDSRLECIGAFIDANNNSITAFATFLLVIVTGILGWIAFFGQENTTRQQLRAYVFPTDAKIVSVNSEGRPNLSRNGMLKPMASGFNVGYEVRFNNLGQTPAYDVTFKSNVALVEWPIDAKKLVFREAKFGSKDTIGQNSMPRTISSKSPWILTEDDIENIKEEKLAICVYGIISYRDAFRNQQTTNFRFFTRGIAALNQIAIHVAEEGNDAT